MLVLGLPRKAVRNSNEIRQDNNPVGQTESVHPPPFCPTPYGPPWTQLCNKPSAILAFSPSYPNNNSSDHHA